MDQVYQDIYQTVWKELFPEGPYPSHEDFIRLFAARLALPQPHQTKSGATVYSSTEYGYQKFISQSEIAQLFENSDFLFPKTALTDLQETLGKVGEIMSFKGDRFQNSDLIQASDDIHSSSYIYESTHVYSSQKILYSYNMTQSEYQLASRGSKSCSFGVAIVDSGSVSNSFDVSWSAKCANCYFCHNAFDLRDCMFCFHISSRQYCIANMQYTEEEYRKIKSRLLNDYLVQLKSEKPFILLEEMR